MTRPKAPPPPPEPIETIFSFSLDEARVRALALGIVPPEVQQTCQDMLVLQAEHTFVIRDPDRES